MACVTGVRDWRDRSRRIRGIGSTSSVGGVSGASAVPRRNEMQRQELQSLPPRQQTTAARGNRSVAVGAHCLGPYTGRRTHVCERRDHGVEGDLIRRWKAFAPHHIGEQGHGILQLVGRRVRLERRVACDAVQLEARFMHSCDPREHRLRRTLARQGSEHVVVPAARQMGARHGRVRHLRRPWARVSRGQGHG